MTFVAAHAGLPMGALPVGAMIPWAGSNTEIPAGWIQCTGGALPRLTYAALFAAIGTTYGPGDGSTTFDLPNQYAAGLGGGKYLLGSNTAGNTANANVHSHASQTLNTNFGVVSDGTATHYHNASIGISPVNVNHTHNQNIGFNSGNSNSNASKASGNTVALQGSAHAHNVGGGWNATSWNHTHNVNAGNTSSSAGDAAHSHGDNTNINNTLRSQGSTGTSGPGSHEQNNFEVVFIIKAS